MEICRVDQNQKEIVQSLRACGRSVQHLHTIGKGCPDILVGFHGKNYLFEIKDGNKSPSQRRLTPLEETWHTLWRGEVHTIHTFEEALLITEKGNKQ